MADPSGEHPVRATILVNGLVQGVGYRAFTIQAAVRKGLSGGVRNLDDGRVEIEVEGRKAVIDELIAELKVGPSRAQVTWIDVRWGKASGVYHDFRIRY